MTPPVRRAGRLVESDGSATTWMVAEGRQGRRWRWVVVGPEGAVVAHTLETDPAGRFLRIESSRSGTLLSLHREADGRLHGNRVTAAGVDHLVFETPTPAHVLVGSGAVGGAAFVAGIGAVAEAVALESLVVGDDLGLAVTAVRVGPIGRRTLELEVGGVVRTIETDADGLPQMPGAGAPAWPLELA